MAKSLVNDRGSAVERRSEERERVERLRRELGKSNAGVAMKQGFKRETKERLVVVLRCRGIVVVGMDFCVGVVVSGLSGIFVVSA